MPSILLVSAVLAVGGVLALAYRGDRQQARYSKLQEGGGEASGLLCLGSDKHQGQQQPHGEDAGWRAQQRMGKQQRREQRREQHPELELLRGSSGDSSSRHSSVRPSVDD